MLCKKLIRTKKNDLRPQSRYHQNHKAFKTTGAERRNDNWYGHSVSLCVCCWSFWSILVGCLIILWLAGSNKTVVAIKTHGWLQSMLMRQGCLSLLKASFLHSSSSPLLLASLVGGGCADWTGLGGEVDYGQRTNLITETKTNPLYHYRSRQGNHTKDHKCQT